MALLWVEGWEDYGTSTTGNLSGTIIGERYTNGTTALRLQSGRFTGFGCGCYGSATDLYTPPLTTDSTIIIGFAFRFMGGPTSTTIIQLYDGGTVGCALAYDGTNLVAKRGSTVLGQVATAMTAQKWLYIEIKVVCDGAAGSFAIRVNDATVLNLTNQSTKAGGHNWHDIVDFYFQGSSTGSYDDIYICDGTGTVNKDFLGQQKVLGLYPGGDGVTSQWTPSSAGTHFSLINEGVEDVDAKYVANTAPGQVDLYTYGGLTGDGLIGGIQINTAVRETDVNTHSLVTEVISNGVTSDDAGQGVGVTSYTNRRRILEADPATGSTWSVAGVNSAVVGIKAG